MQPRQLVGAVDAPAMAAGKAAPALPTPSGRLGRRTALPSAARIPAKPHTGVATKSRQSAPAVRVVESLAQKPAVAPPPPSVGAPTGTPLAPPSGGPLTASSSSPLPRDVPPSLLADAADAVPDVLAPAPVAGPEPSQPTPAPPKVESAAVGHEVGAMPALALSPNPETAAVVEGLRPAESRSGAASGTPLSVKFGFYAILAVLASVAVWPPRRGALGGIGV